MVTRLDAAISSHSVLADQDIPQGVFPLIFAFWSDTYHVVCTWLYILSMCDKLIGKPILRPKLIDFRENTKYILPYHKALSYIHIRRKCSVIEKLYSSFSKFLKALKGFRTSEQLHDKCISIIEPLFLIPMILLSFLYDILKILDP